MTKKTNKFEDEHKRPPVVPMSFNQECYINSLKQYPDQETGSDAFVFGVGRAGTGKTWLATVVGADEYLAKNYRKLIITRPTISCGDELGALPGTLEEKYDPWIANVVEPLKQRIGKGKFECDYGKRIFAEPIQFMRGKTFDDSWIIVDEAQNLTIEQAEMITTRIGTNSKMILCGDTRQNDHAFNYKTQSKAQSGLEYLVNEIRRQAAPGIDIIEFTKKDCVRSKACSKMLDIHDKAVK